MNGDKWGTSHLTGMPVTVWYALIIVLALIVLALLRHLFGSIRVDAGTR